LPQGALLAHRIQALNVPLAIPFALEVGIVVTFVNCLTVQVGKPRFDIPGRDEDGHPFVRSSSLLATFDGGILDLSHPFCDRSTIRIDDYDQCLLNSMLSRSVIGKFFRELCPHELLA
jgi:hypothetical protein